MDPKPFGWVTAKTVAGIEKMSKSIKPDFTTAMIRNTQYSTATIPIYLGAAPPKIIQPVIDAGNRLATIAFNLCQSDDIPAHHRETMRKAYQDWDTARRIT